MSFANSSETCYYLDWVFLFIWRHERKIDAVFDRDFISDYNDSICLGW